MRKRKFTDEQIVKILQEADSGTPVPELCRKHGVSSWTFYKWKKQFKGMSVEETKRLRELEAENKKLKKIVANQALDIDALKDVVRKKW